MDNPEHNIKSRITNNQILKKIYAGFHFKKILISFLFLFWQTVFATEQLIIEPDAGRAPLLKAIKESQQSIDLVVYGFTDPQLLNALVAAKQSGKKIKILIEPHPYRAEDENNFAISRLQEAHIDVQTANPDFKLTHQKTFVFDTHRAIIMTFNLTRSTFKNERNFALVTDNAEVVREIEAVFQSDWTRKKALPHLPQLIWSPDNSQEKILQLITSAKETIEIYAQDLTDYKIIGALAKAARSGKKIQVLLSKPKENHPNKKMAYLERAGVEIRFSQDLIIHAKVLIVDHQKALLGSTNFTYPSMQFNRELSIITDTPDVVRQLVQTFQHDFKSTMQSARHNPFSGTRASSIL